VAEAYVVDADCNPRDLGKMGKVALSPMHPEHFAAPVFTALKCGR
jgi:acetyl-CoA C-acetyltransferase